MSKEAELVRAKILLMDAQIKFLEWVWSNQNREERDFHINNYEGLVPHKYTGD
jgi:hypothetical protein